MKKVLLVVVLAVALSGLLAAPSLAQPQLQDGVYAWIYDGTWFQVTDGQIGDGGDPGTPLPAGQPVWLVTFWGAYGYGHVKSIGNAIVESITIDGTPVVSGAASRSLWSMPYPSEYLNDELDPFNPSMAISGWVAAWLYPVALGPGTYEVSGTETYTHPFTDLAGVRDSGHGPSMNEAGSAEFGPWELVLP